ncbi:MAG: patatin-like phospholipase family protein [Nevskiales bacterium]|nr:patatin-like phospholipase family protein [Nevskiales bacterium]
MNPSTPPTVGLALGSGSARGWAHIGVIQALEEIGVRPQVVAGTSIGALVGGVYVAGQLAEFAEWVRTLTARDVLGFLDISLSGGMFKGEKLFGFFEQRHHNPDIESLEQRFVCVATEMKTGRETWLTRGPLLPATRASCALPGLFPPVQLDGRWMLDGGLVNPVPVSACRALGADVVIAVNLNGQLVGTHVSRSVGGSAENAELSWWQRAAGYLTSGEGQNPSLFDVVATSVNILQDRLTRSRMAGDPPEVALVPRLDDYTLMDFHRADQAIEEGRRVVHENAARIRGWLGIAAD